MKTAARSASTLTRGRPTPKRTTMFYLEDRLVLFRSTLQHEVLVTRRERLALTQWWYGRIDDDNERVPWRLPAPGRAPASST